VFPTRQALLDTVGKRLAWSVEPLIRKVPGGSSLAFSPKELLERQPQPQLLISGVSGRLARSDHATTVLIDTEMTE
jgi:hypothetical protein